MEFTEHITIDHIICLLGLIVLTYWLLKTSLGRKALADSVPRRNNMPFYIPFIPLFLLFISSVVMSIVESTWANSTLVNWKLVFLGNLLGCICVIHVMTLIVVLGRLIETRWCRLALTSSVPIIPLYLLILFWFGAISLPTSIMKQVMGDLPDWQSALFDNFILGLHEIAAVVVIIVIAKFSFAGRLKGFGLNVKTIIKDFFTAFVNLLAVWPLIAAAIIVTMFFGELIWGKEYQMQQHQQLTMITEHPQLSLRILIFITAVVIVPLFEEMLFRGLFQTMIRSYIETRGLGLVAQGAGQVDKVTNIHGAWPAILISSMLFAATHADTGHWPALFVLGVCLGYAYEKSGSLFRPIFIHSLFNAVSIIATLNQ
jgi:membrane protease YdiL (CAAX protease family)